MIYIHVPFCHRKCTYCAFHSKPVAGGQRSVAGYVDALLVEMEQRKAEQPHPIRTVYFGGGTPSILPLPELTRIVDGLHRCFDLSQVEEVTLEANPEDLTPGYLSALISVGFNRLSVGVQSLDDAQLRLLNRRHTAAQALDAIEHAHAAGFRNISVDFIYGLPHDDFQFSIFNFQLINHLSAYALTVEPGTALALQVERGRVVLPSDDEVVRQYHALRRQFEEAGFQQYEVSNFARPGCESLHNSRYWDRTPYLGLGPGAHSFDGRHRRWNHPDNQLYISTLTSSTNDTRPHFSEETLTPADAHNELLMTALRTTRGLPLSAVKEEHRPHLISAMQRYIACGWIAAESDGYQQFFRPTPEGLLHADGIAAELFL